MKNLVTHFVQMPRVLRSTLWRVLHWAILKIDRDGDSNFLNYGFAGSANEFSDLQLTPVQELHRYPIQLYCHVARPHHFPGTKVLEVGCGRGGGAAFLAATFKPEEYCGLDLLEQTIHHCNHVHKVPGLRFVAGDAQNLPFGDGQFDAVINVESARCYPDMAKFFSEVYRVLRPNGKFLFADMIIPADFAGIRSMLLQAGFEIVDERDIRPNVVASLKADSLNRRKEIDASVPKTFRNFFYEFAGVEGTNRFRIFEKGEMGYWSFSLRKGS